MLVNPQLSSILCNTGVSWQTLHKLSPIRYWPSRNDYISLPTAARTNNTVVRWVQAETPPMTSPRVHWAIDDVFIGGKEINPSEYRQSFEDEPEVNDDPSGWEFSPNGVIEGDGGECLVEGQSGSAMVWPDHANKDSGHQMQKFTTNQMIVQPGYMLQFKVKSFFICILHTNTHCSHFKTYTKKTKVINVFLLKKKNYEQFLFYCIVHI